MYKNYPDDIAIIGMAGKFPGANDINQYWSNIIQKICSISHFTNNELIAAGLPPEIVQNPNYVKAKGYLEEADYFDAKFFKFSKHEPEILDPQFRILFEIIWHALEDAAYIPENYSEKTGVFVGSSNVDNYYLQNLLNNTQSSLLTDNFTLMLHNAKDFLSNLIAYKLNLRGPAITVQTACSTSLVAVCMACQSLLNFETNIAIAGGTCVSVPLKSGYLFQNGMMLSPTGKCSTFDKNANGIVLGNGAGIVILKRLQDATKDKDNIQAVIKGFAVNNDGAARIGFTAPGVAGQQSVIEDALRKAQVTADMISYIETHGTGTILGDLIETEALSEVFKKSSKRIALGSVKPNIGHCDAAAGIANLIKVVQALKHETIPPNIHFEELSPQLDFSQKSFYVNTENKPWDSHGGRYAGVSSFGMGGTNAHLIVTEAPAVEKTKGPMTSQLILLSAQSHEALKQMRLSLANFLGGYKKLTLADVAYTLQVGRKHFKYRMAFICNSINDAITKLYQNNQDPFPNDISDLSSLAKQWLAGENVDWALQYHHTAEKPHRISLPAYPFERERYWVSRQDLNLPTFKSVDPNIAKGVRHQAIESIVKEIFERFLTVENINLHCSFEDLGGDSLSALLITHEINKTLSLKLPFSIDENNLSIQALCEHIVNNIENQ